MCVFDACFFNVFLHCNEFVWCRRMLLFGGDRYVVVEGGQELRKKPNSKERNSFVHGII